MSDAKKHSDLYEIIRITTEIEWRKDFNLAKIKKYINAQMQIRIIKHGETISCEDLAGKYVHYVIKGKYIHYRNSKSGKSNIVALHRGPEWIGIDRTLDMERANITEDLAIEECIVVDIKSKYFIQCINEGGDVALYIIKNLLGKMASTSNRVDCMLFNDARTQTLCWFDEYWNSNYTGGGECIIELKNEYIAQSIGISARTLYRVLKGLKAENVITIRKGNIIIKESKIQKITENILEGERRWIK